MTSACSVVILFTLVLFVTWVLSAAADLLAVELVILLPGAGAACPLFTPVGNLLGKDELDPLSGLTELITLTVDPFLALTLVPLLFPTLTDLFLFAVIELPPFIVFLFEDLLLHFQAP